MEVRAVAALLDWAAAAVGKARTLVNRAGGGKRGRERQRHDYDLRPLLERASRRRALYSAIGQAADANDLLRARALWERMESPSKLWWEEQFRFTRSGQDLKQAIRQLYQADEACYPTVAKVLAGKAPGDVPKEVKTAIQPVDAAVQHLSQLAELDGDAR